MRVRFRPIMRATPTQIPALTAKPTQLDPSRERGSPPRTLRHIVQVETNLLRFPFFALHTKGLREIDAKEVRGTRTENGQSHEFVFRVSRNTDHLYPGPLSRKAHFALLSLLRKQGFPFRNPIAFTWRQLAREMQVAYSGSTTISRLKDALHSTLGAMIKSSYALKEGESRITLPARERGYMLYSECLFTNDRRVDGTVADQNFVTLSDWYLANLNSLYAAPIDYALWNRLNDRSPLASRLYEFLLFNFSAAIDTFTINYAKLCQFLPAKVEPYASQAKEQLAPAFRLLLEEGIVGAVNWTTGKRDDLQLNVTRGIHLNEPHAPSTPNVDVQQASKTPSRTAIQPDLFDSVITSESKNALSPAERLVQQFHAAWSGGPATPSSLGELTAAKECLDHYGFDLASQLLPKVIKRMREKFPDAKTFGAARPYFTELHAEHEKRQRIADILKATNLKEEMEAEQHHQKEVRNATLESAWHSLPIADQNSIRESVVANNPRLLLHKHPVLLHRFCLDELGRRSLPAD